MEQFLEAVVAFPTVIFSVLMGVVLAFWGIAMVGVIDIDFLDFDADLDALDSLGGDVDIDVDLDADIDADVDGDVDGAGHAGSALGSVLTHCGLSGVPITIALSLVTIVAWTTSMIITAPALALVPAGFMGSLMAVGVVIVSLAVGVPVAAMAVRPLRGVYVTHQAVSNRTLVGKTCVIATGRVTNTFGQAEIEDGGAGFLVQVRCSRENSLTKLSRTIVCDYDEEREVFLVTPDPVAALPGDIN